MDALIPWTVVFVSGAMLARAETTAANPYVGSKVCFGCHAGIYKSFQRTDMGRSVTLASDWKTGEQQNETTVPLPGAERAYSVSHDSSGWHQTEMQAGEALASYTLDYAVGTGHNGVTFLIRRGKFLFEAPLSYYSTAAQWGLSPGYEKVDFGFNRRAPEECMNCHAGRINPLTGSPGAFADPPFKELSVGCENCHGPGGAHVASRGKRPASIVNPAKLTPRLAENVCIGCHQTGDARVTQPGKTYLDFRPGQWLFDTAVVFKLPRKAGTVRDDLLEHFSAMQASRCFRASSGKLSCLTCHDPHVQPNATEAPEYFRRKCLTCHSEQSCKLSLALRSSRTPADDCAGCHMPKRSVRQISHSALTNHAIPAREGEVPPELPEKVRSGVVVIDPPGDRTFQLSKITLLKAYQQMSSKDATYQQLFSDLLAEVAKENVQDPYVEAQLGDKAFRENRFDDAVTHLTRAVPENQSPIYLELGQALAKVGRVNEALECLKKGVDLDPYDAVMQKTLILDYINLRQYAEARERMQEYVATFPGDTFMRGLLQRVSQ